jgi:hypothetical protein
MEKKFYDISSTDGLQGPEGEPDLVGSDEVSDSANQPVPYGGDIRKLRPRVPNRQRRHSSDRLIDGVMAVQAMRQKRLRAN